MAGVSGDFGRLTGTIAALNQLARIPSRVAVIAAPKLQAQMRKDAGAEKDPYARAFAPHKPATTKRWGAHSVLDLTGAGIGSIQAKPAAGAGITLTADDHMAFTQAGTPTQVVRAIFPNTPSLPASWRRILEASTEEALGDALKAAG